MNLLKKLEQLQLDLAASMLREQQHKEDMARDMREASARSSGLIEKASLEGLKKARVERETAEMIERAMAEAIAQNRNPLQQYD